MRLPERAASVGADLLTEAPARAAPESRAVVRRRRISVVATLVIGAVLLGLALREPASGTAFRILAAVLAGVWLVGGLVSGPVHLGRFRGRRPVGWPILVGALAFGVFAIGALAVSWIPVLHNAVLDVVSRADNGSRAVIVIITIVNGIAEEVFFRGAVYSAFGEHRPWLWTTLTYAVVTAAAGNVMLLFAGVLMGSLWALQRRATAGILASALTHVTWSTMVIFLLPR